MKRKVVNKLSKKINKKKIIKKGITYSLETLIGGPYYDGLKYLFKKSKKIVIKHTKDYATRSFFTSEYVKQNLNMIPITVVTLCLRILFNIMVMNNLRTGNYWVNFFVSIFVTVSFILLSPLIYKSIEVHETFFTHYTNLFVNRLLGDNVVNFLINLKNFILILLSVLIIFLLQFISIDSKYLQELVIHGLLTGIISDLIQRLFIDSNVSYFVVKLEKLTKEERLILPAKLRVCRVRKCHTKNIIINLPKPRVGKKITFNKIFKNQKKEKKEKQIILGIKT